jgi:anti-anti-sigma factor
MKIKVDTKEKFTVLHLSEALFSENMAEELAATVANLLQQPVKNVVVDFAKVTNAAQAALTALAGLYQKAVENNVSFVLYNLNASVKKLLDEQDLTDVLNITPTESEACDMVYMEEMEREMF